MSLTREQILGADDLVREEVQVPEWGGSVFVQVMSGTDRDAYEVQSFRDKAKSLANMRAGLVARCVVDESGSLLFSVADVEALGRKNGIALDRLAQVAQRINRMSEKDVKEAEGNSGPSPGGAQSSDSP